MIRRDIESYLKRLTQQSRVVALTGPRQSGKTTLCKSEFADYSYYNLENINTFNTVTADPVGFVETNSRAVIDEIQKYPDLLSQVQVQVDERGRYGDYVITGSQNLLLSEKISQSLAGRASYATLLPLSIHELKNADLLCDSFVDQIIRGFYPETYAADINTDIFYERYLRTYVERDVRMIRNISDLSTFQRFLGLLAGRIGQLVNRESLAGDVGVNAKTIENWISILEASYVIYRLRPYHVNFGKRLIRASKIYFHDTGLACHLLGITDRNILENHYLRGGLFENMVILDILKNISSGMLHSNTKLHFYRDNGGNEIDLVIDNGKERLLMEIKSGSTFASDFLKGIKAFERASGTASKSVIVYAGQKGQVGNTSLVNWRDMEVCW
ncbi:MAG: ATP-binding protein [Coriobacteriales bacterium]|jgi:predicted AAA+ superfamily ATPase|nr:ATP-binding protein [Coriobacteriales bacterium]